MFPEISKTRFLGIASQLSRDTKIKALFSFEIFLLFGTVALLFLVFFSVYTTKNILIHDDLFSS
jgi:hypothetical protein